MTSDSCITLDFSLDQKIIQYLYYYYLVLSFLLNRKVNESAHNCNGHRPLMSFWNLGQVHLKHFSRIVNTSSLLFAQRTASSVSSERGVVFIPEELSSNKLCVWQTGFLNAQWLYYGLKTTKHCKIIQCKAILTTLYRQCRTTTVNNSTLWRMSKCLTAYRLEEEEGWSISVGRRRRRRVKLGHCSIINKIPAERQSIWCTRHISMLWRICANMGQYLQ